MIDQSWAYAIFMHSRAIEKAMPKMKMRPIDELDQTIASRAANPSQVDTTQLLAGGVAKIVREDHGRSCRGRRSRRRTGRGR